GGISLIKKYIEMGCDDELLAEFKNILSVADNGFYKIDRASYKPLTYIWFARELISRKAFDLLAPLFIELEKFGDAWLRHLATIKILSEVAQKNVEQAIRYANEILIQNKDFAFELPLKTIFADAKWKEFHTLY